MMFALNSNGRFVICIIPHPASSVAHPKIEPKTQKLSMAQLQKNNCCRKKLVDARLPSSGSCGNDLHFPFPFVTSPSFISSTLCSMETAPSVAPAETSTKPVKVFRDGHLSVPIFPNQVTVRDRQMTFYNAVPQRSYKDGKGFKTTYSLSKDDIPTMQLLLGQAWEWIVNEQAASRKLTK